MPEQWVSVLLVFFQKERENDSVIYLEFNTITSTTNKTTITAIIVKNKNKGKSI